MQREVDVKAFIPEKFFDFEHLEEYDNCIRHSRSGGLTASKNELCALSKEDVKNPVIVNKNRNTVILHFQIVSANILKATCGTEREHLA